jgi:hypothetical protein
VKRISIRIAWNWPWKRRHGQKAESCSASLTALKRNPYKKTEDSSLASKKNKTLSFGNISVLVLTCILMSGCAASVPLCPDGQTLMTGESLYFGTAWRGGTVTALDWQNFLDETISPRFPEGFSVWLASGQWKSADGRIIREGSYVVNIIHPDTLAASVALDEIVSTYKSKFQQEAVLRVKNPVCVSF